MQNDLKILVSIPVDHVARLDRLKVALERANPHVRGVSRSNLIRQAVVEYLDREEVQAAEDAPAL